VGVERFRRLLAKDFVVTVELDPPRGTDMTRSLREARALRGKVAAVNIADSPMANLRMSPIALACLIRDQVGIDTIFHITCRDRSLLGMQSELLGAWAMGVGNLLALTGDPPSRGDHPQSTGVFDLDVLGLLRLVSGLNRGEDANGKSLRGGCDFCVGAAANPAAADLSVEFSKLRAKVEAGADFTQTQPVYRARDAEEFLQEASSLELPAIIGILPIKSHKMLRYLDENVPGITIPPEVRDRLAKSPAEGVRDESVLLSRELIEDLRGKAAGVHIMPVGEASLVGDILGEDAAPLRVGAEEGETVEEAVREASAAGRISCRAALGIAADKGVSPAEVGRAIDEMGIKISACQLGCFK
jgi:5,10-methylenetetrahydrofolate reductase